MTHFEIGLFPIGKDAERVRVLDGAGVQVGAGEVHALLGENGTLLANPYHYRDARTDGVMERMFARVPADDIYGETGIQFMQLNTLYQLYAVRQARSETLERANIPVLRDDRDSAITPTSARRMKSNSVKGARRVS